MIYEGHIQNGMVVFDEDMPLPDGTSVQVRLIDEQMGQSLADRLLKLAGIIEDGLPRDLARNHDHYLHGQEKR